MVEFATAKGWRGGNYKGLNLAFENRIMGQPQAVRERMARRVADFVYNLLVKVFNAADTAPLAYEAIIKADSYQPCPKAKRIEDPAQWTGAKIADRASDINTGKGPAGNFDD